VACTEAAKHEELEREDESSEDEERKALSDNCREEPQAERTIWIEVVWERTGWDF